jgi:NhaP-type Na+/H+ or K+/H+ antiporter
VEIGFPTAVLVFGGLLWVAAMLSGVMRGTVLSISIFSVACGFALAELGVVAVSPGSAGLRHLAEIALILTLFSDGLIVQRELLRRHWDSPARSLAVAMPLTMALIALAAYLLFPSLSWAEAFLLGAILAPTDPVVSSQVVSDENVPIRIRHALNLESGLNDGLAVPLVLFFLILATPGGAPIEEGLRLLGEAVAGLAIGVGLGYASGRLHPRLPLGGVVEQYAGIFALGVALSAYGVAELTIGNGLIAAFCAGAALAQVEESGLPEELGAFSEYSSSVAQVVTFFAFGALIVTIGFDASIPALVAMIPFVFLVARPVAVYLASAGAGLEPRERGFVAWFGPKGVASMLFSLFVLESQTPHAGLIFEAASYVILASILAHGLTDTLAARRLFGGERSS